MRSWSSSAATFSPDMGKTRAYLLDTHVLLWWLNGDERLSPERERILSAHRCLVSSASIWEVAIKHRLGKLPLPPEVLIHIARDAGFESLPITSEHAAATSALPPHHQDPFDRLLLAQARLEQLSLITADAHLLRYGDAVEPL